MRRILAALAFLTLSSPSAYPWGETGHFAVCEIAYRNLNWKAKQTVDKLSGGAAFAELCTWADRVRRTPEWKHTYPWHFINLDEGETYPETINQEGDAVQALIATEDVLRSDKSSDAEKADYLKLFTHFAGDIHQPLHFGRKSDKGGNTIFVSWFGKVEDTYQEVIDGKPITRKFKINIHSVWDALFIDKFIQDNKLDATGHAYAAYAAKIDTASDKEIKKWQTANYLDWALESFEARGKAYDVGSGKLGQKYYNANINLVNQRVLMAGYRLAGALNKIFSETPLSQSEKDMREKIRKALEK